MTAMRHRPHPRLRSLELLIAAFLLAISSVSAQIGPIEDLSAFPSAKLEIADGKKVRHTFDVWLADTPARQAQGLMFVRSLPPARGMLFVHASPRPISMWMKNTYIPLDMVFIDDRGRIQQIIANTKPHSLDLVRSTAPAVAVLELAGGEAERLGLKPGQRVTHPALTHR
jgi:uncharacterized membrane protein (UPF0127 family)